MQCEDPLISDLLISEFRAAELISVPVNRLRRMVNRGQIPCRELPDGERRFEPHELREWVQRLPHSADHRLSENADRVE